MIHEQAVKYFLVTPPAAILDDASAATAEIDTKGFDYLTVVHQIGATDIAMAALKLQESDETGTGFADIAESVFGGTDLPALPSATNDNKLFVHFVKLNGRKRFIEVVATAGNGTAGTYYGCLAILSRAAEMPIDVAGRGIQAEIKL